MFLSDFGMDREAVDLVRDRAIPDGGRVLFPFSLGGGTLSHEEVSITGRVKKAEKGLFLAAPDRYGIRTAAFFFPDVLEMLLFYDRHPKTAFANAALIIDPLPPTREALAFFRESFGHVRSHVIVASNSLYGICRTIALAAMLNGREPKITREGEAVLVRMDGKEGKYTADRYGYGRFARDFRIPRTTGAVWPRGFASFTEMYGKNNERLRACSGH